MIDLGNKKIIIKKLPTNNKPNLNKRNWYKTNMTWACNNHQAHEAGGCSAFCPKWYIKTPAKPTLKREAERQWKKKASPKNVSLDYHNVVAGLCADWPFLWAMWVWFVTARQKTVTTYPSVTRCLNEKENQSRIQTNTRYKDGRFNLSWMWARVPLFSCVWMS